MGFTLKWASILKGLICSLFVLWIQEDPGRADVWCPGGFQDSVLMPDDHRKEVPRERLLPAETDAQTSHVDAVIVMGFLLAWVPLSSPLFKGFSEKLGRSVGLPRSHDPGVTAETTLGAAVLPDTPVERVLRG